MSEYFETQIENETAVLVGLAQRGQDMEQVEEYLEELDFLATTAEIETKHRFVQRMDLPDRKTFIGSGKLNEVKLYVKENEIDTVIFDDELSPSQLRNIEKELKVKIMDRNILILEIFEIRARTAHAKAQVQLARFEYMLPRLTRMWTHLERQRGGTGTRGGAGEKEIETDRRIIRTRISKLKVKLKEIDKQKATQRGNRGKMVRVSLVGYTNVGKSTVMNLLSKSEVFAENKLFATLDTTVRKVVVGNLPFLLSDTVGFIRKLPHQLIESFKSTLDEVREADILVHVVDISHENFEDHYRTVNSTLAELKVLDKPIILVFNKIDAFSYVRKEEDDLTPMEKENISLEELKRTWMAKLEGVETVFISATKKKNIEELREKLYAAVKKVHEVRYPYNDYLY